MLLVSIDKLKKYYLDRLILDIYKFEIQENDKIGLVGANGAGKTTLIKTLIRDTDIDEGHVYLTNSYSYVSQNEDIKDLYIDNKIKSLLNAPNKFEDYLSGGEKVKLKIVNALKEKKKLIIADEPTSNLDQESIKILEKMLKNHNGALLLVSHDRQFLDSLCNTIVEIDEGKIKVYKGNYTTYLKLKEKEVKRQEFEHEQYKIEKNRLENAKIQKNELKNSIRKTPKRMGNSEARLHKMGGQRGKKNLDGNIKAIQSRIDKLEVKEKPKNINQIKIYIQDGMEIVSKNLIEVKDLTLKVDEKLLLNDVSFKIKRNKKIALIGENGCGKSSLIKEILKNNNEAIKINERVKIGYFSQSQDTLNMNKSILDNIKEVSSFDETFIRINLNLFGFKGDEVYKKVGVLSGGEKVKVALCKIILEDNNLLLLDEPTNYLDIISMEALEKSLRSTNKTMLIVSHDRSFISSVCDYIIEIKDKSLREFNGNLNEYEKSKTIVKLDKQEQIDKDKILVLENKLSHIISMLCIEDNINKKQEYEKEYESLLNKINKLKNK
ncbi:ABC-F family ATP-binding cassette domain-containing protein [Paeniclostridium sp. NSJ-45]|uniref:ABC-F family ATP-binding cassette domain-containing protein n=1 Tax=Paeniclostridium hominis TaxID=2764329 RepID=A0ABR7K2V5_9FIRM|nr:MULTISPECIES: ABC-F type ribosomal protection protein CplR [Paeniclostridium]MBC6003420.1 ABC-F family ATP-binding cassette domain-containing protein [Paeniclostridium hominis]